MLEDENRQLKYFGHVTRMGDERLPSRAQLDNIEGKRSRERQAARRWIDDIKEEDLGKQNLNLEEVTQETGRPGFISF